jgi:predicted Zn finger-like uncharacterized protein
MKIECDKCGAKYSIADEKVRGKTFKIRCKKCSNVIIVRDKASSAAGGGDDAADDAGAAVGWHLAINGETVGPMGEDEVRQRYEAGEIDKETAIWQEGFEDWIPLADVDVFASLPDRAAAAVGSSEDPFASANQDNYAATGGAVAMGGGAAAAFGGGDPSPQSPRVSSLTGQRNENSVLFSLDSLQAIATGGGAAAAAPMAARAASPVAARAAANPSKGLATSAPSSEGSGLIDIRALGAMVGGNDAMPSAAAAPNRAADDAALPSFGGAGIGGLAGAPLLAPSMPAEAAAVAAAAHAPPQRSNAPLYVMMIVLILAVVGLAAFILLREEKPPQIVQQPVAEAPSVKAAADGADKDDDDDDKDKDDKDKDDEDKDDEDKDKDDGDDEGEDAADEGEDAAADDGASEAGSNGKKKSTNTTKKKSNNTSTSPTPTTAPPPKKKEEDLSVDCIIDPASCGKGGKKSSTTTTKKADPSLPETLTQADIKAGVGPHKDAAKACGAKNGATPGEKVTIKLSISGATGTVSSASATGKHAGTALGNCAAAALKKATFKKFQKSSIGVQYPVRM